MAGWNYRRMTLGKMCVLLHLALDCRAHGWYNKCARGEHQRQYGLGRGGPERTFVRQHEATDLRPLLLQPTGGTMNRPHSPRWWLLYAFLPAVIAALFAIQILKLPGLWQPIT